MGNLPGTFGRQMFAESDTPSLMGIFMSNSNRISCCGCDSLSTHEGSAFKNHGSLLVTPSPDPEAPDLACSVSPVSTAGTKGRAVTALPANPLIKSRRPIEFLNMSPLFLSIDLLGSRPAPSYRSQTERADELATTGLSPAALE